MNCRQYKTIKKEREREEIKKAHTCIEGWGERNVQKKEKKKEKKSFSKREKGEIFREE